MFRNIFDTEDKSEYHEAVQEFPNKVPRFYSKQACMEFVQKHCTKGSNPDYPNLYHSTTTLIDWQQIKTHLIPRIQQYEYQWEEVTWTEEDIQNNRFMKTSGNNEESSPVFEYLKSRLDLSVHQHLSPESTLNTLNYCFHHMRCGIFLMIRNNQVVIFCPFVNKDYKNSWGNTLRLDCLEGTVEAYYENKKEVLRRGEVRYDKIAS